ncbi:MULTISPECIES: dTMP kinase [unclassified Streptomyces]|uniref:dTMP kinase n=1 Tax=unclassified Streptomyces TaxID=2593676 RepID=UPI000DAE5945|nr:MULTISPECIES: thymidylate kinase [unclassified Streptomyces]PZT77247.1 thymidylate kinase [Streptomyces sp. AC1-42W]PZT78801.1 thymidylate kinase [Streptomyces sp. AC1-42T]
MLLALTGTDGVGKSTVTRAFVAELNARGYRARTVDRWDIVADSRYPAARFLSHDIRDIRTCIADMPGTSRLLFLIWSMAMALEGVREEPGEVVVVDGYWMKHAAGEIAYGLDPEWVEALVAGVPTADLTVRLSLDLATAWQRKQGDLVPYECGMDPACAEDSFLAHQRSISDHLDRWTKRHHWPTVDADRPVPLIVAELAGLVERAEQDHHQFPPSGDSRA